MKGKIFGIGLSKTGTTSLNTALKILGYRARHFPLKMCEYKSDRLSLNADCVRKWDAITDIPAARFYKELDKNFPDSKFILTVRDMDSWLDSCKRHFWPGQLLRRKTNWINKLVKDIYGSIDFNEAKFKHAYEKHIQNVTNYFENKKQDLLVMDIVGNEGWKKLCPFLNKNIPNRTFPKKDCLYSQVFKILKPYKLRK